MILALDQGTTGTTALLLDAEGRLRGRGYAELPQHFPCPGWVEHDPDEIWASVTAAAAAALAAAGVPATAVRAVGLTNQRETVVLWERATGRPLHRALVWQDRRTADVCLARAAWNDELRRRTGLVLDPYFSATKIAWLLDHLPAARRRAEAGELAVGTVDSWLLWRLTGGRVHATDPTNASRTLLYDLRTGTWAPDLLDRFGVPAALLPTIRPSAGDFGATDPERFLGVAAPIGGVAGDQQAALVGQGCCRPGLAKNTYGTGAFLLLHTGARPVVSRHGLLTTVACGPRGERAFALEGSIFIAGAAIQWLRDGLGLLRQAAESEALARSLEDNDGVYFVPAFVGLGAPHWEPRARGTLVGLTRGTTRAHLARAALEAMAYATADVVGAMAADAGAPLERLRVDGGAAANDWLLQFQADVLAVPVERPALVESTALGAAALAGVGAGLWPTVEDFLAGQPPARRFLPRDLRPRRDAWLAGWRRAVAAARAWAQAAEDAAS